MAGKPQARIGDMTTGHWIDIFYFPPVPMITGSPDTFSCGHISACRILDVADPHIGYVGGTIPVPGLIHNPVAFAGSMTCFINGKNAFRIGDSFDCGDIQAEGCPTHLVCD